MTELLELSEQEYNSDWYAKAPLEKMDNMQERTHGQWKRKDGDSN